MNVITRGARNAFRSPLRSGAIVIMLAISIGLVLAMLVARTSINQKISNVASTTGTKVTINPAGVMGGFGGGNPLATAQVAQIKNTAHITAVTSTLTDQLGSTDTNLTSSLTLGSFGKRQQRFDNSDSGAGSAFANRPAPTPHISVTGSSDPSTTVTVSQLTSGSMIDGNSGSNVALVGSDLATKNNLKVGDTFTAYGQTFIVQGIYKTATTFQNSAIIMPLLTVQTLSGQAGAVSDVNATVDTASNVSSVVSSLTKTLGSAADITSQQQQAENSVTSLKGIAQLALYGVIGAAAAGAVIVLLAMIVVVRERRREIGIIKAIGGTNQTVITQFMTEALTLTVIGGVIGLVFGVLVSGPMTSSFVANNQTQTTTQRAGRGGAGGFGGFRQIGTLGSAASTNIHTVTTTLTPSAFGISIISILAIAIIGSAVPAWLIARVRPAEVLRSQ